MSNTAAPILLQDVRVDLRGRRVVVYGVANAVGRAIVDVLRAAGAEVGLTSASTDGNALFALKRSAAGSPTQAVDLSNPTSVRVATRKVAKQLGGVDVAVLVLPAALDPRDVLVIAERETTRGGAGALILIGPLPPGDSPTSLVAVDAPHASPAEIATLVAYLSALQRPSGPRATTIQDGQALPIDPNP